MEFTKEVIEVFKIVMKFQNKNSIKINVDGDNIATLTYDVHNMADGEEFINIENINIVANKHTQEKLKNIQFSVEAGEIIFSHIGPCPLCSSSCHNCANNK